MGCLFCLVAHLSAASANTPPQTVAQVCDHAAREASQRYDVPLDILLSIARVESGRGARQEPWPWTINATGQGYWFDTKQEAIDFAAEQLAAGSANFDIGCFQINLHWHPDAFASLDDALNPAKNADYAARFLSTLFDADGDWKSAVAAYHSRSTELGQTYVARVEAAFEDQMRSVDTDIAPEAVEADPPPNRFPLLQGGEPAGFGSLVPRQSVTIALIEGAP